MDTLLDFLSQIALPLVMIHAVPVVAFLVPPATFLFALLLLLEAIKALRKSQPWLPALLKSGCYFVFFLKLVLL